MKTGQSRHLGEKGWQDAAEYEEETRKASKNSGVVEKKTNGWCD